MQGRRWWTDLTLALAAVFIAFVLWLIAKQDDQGRTWIKATVALVNQSDNMTVDAPHEINLFVQYPKSASKNIVSRNFTVKLDVASIFSADPTQWSQPDEVKTSDHTFDPEEVVVERMDQNVQVISFDPRSAVLSAKLLTRRFHVKAPTTGKLPGQLELVAPPAPDPEWIVGTGSKEVLDKLAAAGDTIMTEPIDIGQVTESKQLFPKLIVPAELKLVNHKDARITINIAVKEKDVRRTLEKVPVELFALNADLKIEASPAAVDVVVEGPFSVVQALKPGDFVFSTSGTLTEAAGPPQPVGIEAKLKKNVAPEISRRITVHECKPSRITVEFKPAKAQNAGGL